MPFFGLINHIQQNKKAIRLSSRAFLIQTNGLCIKIDSTYEAGSAQMQGVHLERVHDVL